MAVMIDDTRLNAGQERAVTYPITKPLRVVAGAGTGKTTVLTNRFICLVEKHGIPQDRILTLTFTTKAADEMKASIIEACCARKLIRGRAQMAEAWISNFHSFCHRVLRMDPYAVGLSPDFRVATEPEQVQIFNRVVERFMNIELRYDEVAYHRFGELPFENSDALSEYILKIISRLKDCFVDYRDFPLVARQKATSTHNDIATALRAGAEDESLHARTRKASQKDLTLLGEQRSVEDVMIDVVYSLYRGYQESLDAADLVDYGDLIFKAYQLIAGTDAWKRRFGYVLVDEFQDTNRAQFKLLEALTDEFRNVTVVGDRKQAIYEWREARLENMNDFPGETICLQENYRSCREILEVSNYSIGQTMADEPPLVPGLLDQRDLEDGPQVYLFHCEDRPTEAEFIGSEAVNLIENHGHAPGDIVILMRSVRGSGPYEEVLKRAGLRSRTIGGRGSVALSEIRDIVAYLRVVNDPFDDVALLRVLQSPPIGLSDSTLVRMRQNAAKERDRREKVSLYDLLRTVDGDDELLDADSMARIRRFGEILEHLIRLKGRVSLAELVSEVIAKSQYLKWVAVEEGQGYNAWENVSRLLKKAVQFQDDGSISLSDFLGHLELLAERDLSYEEWEIKGGDVVHIMTVHQAKGLEFPVVFVAGVTRGRFPLRRRLDAYLYDENYGLLIRKDFQGQEMVKYSRLMDKVEKERFEREERRIFYVALSRAKERLYVSSPSLKSLEGPKGFYTELLSFQRGDGRAFCSLSTMPETALMRQETEPLSHANLGDIERLTDVTLSRLRPVAGVEVCDGTRRSLRLDFTKINIYERCPQMYRYRYVLGIPAEPIELADDETVGRTPASPMLLGSIVHRTLRDFHVERRRGRVPDILGIFRDICRAEGIEERRFVAEYEPLGRQLLGRYLSSELAQTETEFEEKEFHLCLVRDGLHLMIDGRIDRIHREGSTWKIIDYKTFRPAAADGGHAAGTRYRLQLGIYRIAAQEVFHLPDARTSLFYLSDGLEEAMEFSETELAEIEEHMLDVAERVLSGDFAVDEDRHAARDCNLCSYKPFCGCCKV